MYRSTKKNLANCEEKFEDKKEFVDEMASDFIKNGVINQVILRNISMI